MEGLVNFVGHSPSRQPEPRQVQALPVQSLERNVLDVVALLMDALETIDSATAADDVTAAGFALVLIPMYRRSFSLDSCTAFTALAALAGHSNIILIQRCIDVNSDQLANAV